MTSNQQAKDTELQRVYGLVNHWYEENKRLEHAFKNFHRLLCERFDYGHDEKDWQRDQLSLIEWIAKRCSVHETAAPQAPIARVTIGDDGMAVRTGLYAPGLPPGEHDLYCEPEATAPYLRAEKANEPRSPAGDYICLAHKYHGKTPCRWCPPLQAPSQPAPEKCKNCSGRKTVSRHSAGGYDQTKTCERCRGTGIEPTK